MEPLIEKIREELNSLKELNGQIEMNFSEFAIWWGFDLSDDRIEFLAEDMYHKLFKNGIFKGGI